MLRSLGVLPPRYVLAERIRVEQIDTLYRHAPLGVLGALVAAIVLVATLIDVGDLHWTTGLVWLALGLGCVSFHLILWQLYRRTRVAERYWRLWAHWFIAAALADGIWWGCATLFLVPQSHVETQFLAIVVAFTVATGAVPAFGAYLPAFFAIFLPINVLAIVANISGSGALHHAAAALIGVFIVTMGGVARGANANFVEMLRTRFEKDALAEDLRRQKEIAEEASLAKSRFLATASHDLRQPVHALGMFVGALSHHAMSDDMRRLVDHMEGSIESMDHLFSALLDISKLDAGVVQPRLQSFPLAPLLTRVGQEYAAQARQKGLTLAVCPSTVIVHSDPVLLGRILRNLVSNAVRYTDHGKILVGCRGGLRLSLEVWDTGRGIGPRERDRVFQEFYQVESSERAQSKGLGLGLAIVKRLTVLLDHPLVLSSQLGKGSVFRIALPLGAAGAVDALAAPVVSVAAPVGLILVIDDEPMVQEAMRSLLTSWGNEVVVAGSRAELHERLVARRPDLIICDYGLRGDENGIDVIRLLRAEYDADVPAVLITGDTASDRLQQARDSGLVVLNKPVVNSKLRATIGNIMNRGSRPPCPHERAESGHLLNKILGG